MGGGREVIHVGVVGVVVVAVGAGAGGEHGRLRGGAPAPVLIEGEAVYRSWRPYAGVARVRVGRRSNLK